MSPSPDKPAASGNPPAGYDPFEMWRQVYETNEKAWSETLERLTSTPSFAESQGKLLETLLAAQKQMRDSTRLFLESANFPTRDDIARLGEILVGLEEKIDQLDERLGDIQQAVNRRVGADAAEPAESASRPARARSAGRRTAT